MSWWSFLSGRKATAAQVAAPPSMRKPIEPFETLEDKGPPFGVRLVRPLVYILEHQMLPQCLFGGHPELEAALLGSSSKGEAFWHMWSKSAVACESSGIWPEDTFDDDPDRYANYVRPLIESVVRTVHPVEGFTIWVLRMPRPETVAEAHFVAMCRPRGSAQNGSEHGPWASSRYFTFEASVEPDEPCFCEWTREGRHLNFGSRPMLTLDGFVEVVRQKLASVP